MEHGDAWTPHGHCYLWDPTVLYMHVVSNAVIGVSYLIITGLFFAFYLSRHDWPARATGAFLVSGLYVFSCGLSHLIDIVTTYRPYYVAEGFSLMATAFFSFVAVPVLALAFRHLSMLPSAHQREVNEKLAVLKKAVDALHAQNAGSTKSPRPK